MPAIPGSLGSWNVPVARTTNWAVMWSALSVSTFQRRIDSSQAAEVIPVWNLACDSRSHFAAMRSHCLRISGAGGKRSAGLYPVSSRKGRYTRDSRSQAAPNDG